LISATLQKYPKNVDALKRIMALYRLQGNKEKENEILNIAYELEPDDFLLVVFKANYLEEKDTLESINVLENWILINPTSPSLDTAYQKIIR
ncbi:hypothetical protein, partial [Bacillus sp. SIMBA_033]